MATAERAIKIEDSQSPEPIVISVPPSPVSSALPTTPIDPKDPENFLKRCSGTNKKTKQRCNSIIGQKVQQNCHPSLLPTCRAHRDQESLAGWCQYAYLPGERCGRLFRWRPGPPYFELCDEHQGQSDMPCYFFKLPLELRHEIFRYLLPNEAIGSSTAALHDGQEEDNAPNRHINALIHSRRAAGRRPFMTLVPRRDNSGSSFPVPLLDLFLISRQTYQDVKDLLFSTVPFTIDVRKGKVYVRITCETNTDFLHV
jgi:hypothetical protein